MALSMPVSLKRGSEISIDPASIAAFMTQLP
jgi:hypothetical protein